jgi:ElaB/YqjD/DUF883 family membrane-anchored ribosome-binding protein
MARGQVEGPGGTQATHSATSGEFGSIADDLGHETRNTGIPAELGIDGVNGARARLQQRASRAVEVSNEYLRTHDFDEMRTDLEREIRAHPIKSIAIALGAGYVLGKIFK